MLKKTISIILIMLLLVSNMSSLAIADAEMGRNVVVSLGKNLTNEQRSSMLNYFGVSNDVDIVEVTNAEEREYLGKYIDDKLLGTRSLSCAYVEKLDEGSGISVDTHNISWVTKDMYENALITAGIKDAKVVVASPINVSGTAALTGIIKAFEDITGEDISKKEKEVASEEIAKTAMLGNEIGKDEASELIENVKVDVVANNKKSKKDIKEAVESAADELQIQLTEEQINEIVDLMRKISKLDLNLDDIKTQLKDISGKIDKIVNQNEEVKSFLQRIVDYIGEFFSKLFG
ncbi:DUF1002 domain-containing protein [Anaerosalibacter bizertensis]|uniref:DUF1002 domain-containing protein n=1 Tax=Anaerosalibacter bizertensis TaxID=932217 RepID=A0A9Q4FLB4_9FIRM|nr:DUF1002 domain-containing protein [Anaerosalibacter bizertensis]MBV1816770.1 DUF1002 domain-containing protein [Bacteroidales bacterium MSK.15.36]MBU5293699.1 DUF1002 domain-containing protein [Anaerosalibacter bizertensis]MCB5560577.1 DUF1002 domain-containing protein [Anaerosalibacter bizertensis]MCG4564400.1 DUF1002 domain-containing protein [Anaerosalibacter bizertensis]MCG4582500.1 DUF1002 domain-containing protein [Anaerosalibacter bizertensis]